jgi:hypothetical protein
VDDKLVLTEYNKTFTRRFRHVYCEVILLIFASRIESLPASDDTLATLR